MSRARDAWNANAAYWHERMGEGNAFVEHLVEPATRRLLQIEPGMRLLDIACGTGVSSRRYAAAGAQVTAFDFSEEMIGIARSGNLADRIDYRVLDATDEQALASLGPDRYDAAISWMALFDMEEIAPLSRALTPLLKPGAPFVFAVIHPCFNNNSTVFVHEQAQGDTDWVAQHSVKISSYLTPTVKDGYAMTGQPVAHPYFHRPLHALLQPFFEAGFALDGLEEPGFPRDSERTKPELGWGGHLHDIPPVLAARMSCRA